MRDASATQRELVVVTADARAALYNSSVTAPADVARAYFAAVTAHDPDAVHSCFADDAELVTNTGTYHGAEAIGGFYRDALLETRGVRPAPGPLIVDGNRVAVEIDLLTDGRHIAVGDFFTIEDGKITRLVIFFGHELT
jgi:ketosteroid isomerase-like protein